MRAIVGESRHGKDVVYIRFEFHGVLGLITENGTKERKG